MDQSSFIPSFFSLLLSPILSHLLGFSSSFILLPLSSNPIPQISLCCCYFQAKPKKNQEIKELMRRKVKEKKNFYSPRFSKFSTNLFFFKIHSPPQKIPILKIPNSPPSLYSLFPIPFPPLYFHSPQPPSTFHPLKFPLKTLSSSPASVASTAHPARRSQTQPAPASTEYSAASPSLLAAFLSSSLCSSSYRPHSS